MDGEPAVTLRLGDEYVNMPLADARKVALDILSATVAAEQDAGIVAYLRARDESDQQIAAILTVLREARHADH